MPFTPEEKVKTLLAEYSSLRAEIVAKTGHGFQVAGFVVTALSFLVAQSRELLTLPVFYAILALIIGASVLTLRDVARAAKRIRQIEADLNKLPGENLLVWETEWGWGKSPKHDAG
jgi:hypothetical protein